MLHTALGINIAYFAAPDINEIFTDVQNDAPGAVELYNLVTTASSLNLTYFVGRSTRRDG